MTARLASLGLLAKLASASCASLGSSGGFADLAGGEAGLPAQSSMLLDLDAAEGVTNTGDGTNATAWESQVGDLTANAIASREPTYIESGGIGSLPCLRTTGGDVMALSDDLRTEAGPVTIMMVLDDTAPTRTSFRYAMGQASPLWLAEQTKSDGTVGYYSGGHVGTGMSLEGEQILTWTMQAGEVAAYRDRQRLNTKDTYTEVALDGVQLFGYSGSGSAYGDFYRILVWDKVLSQSELEQAWSFLSAAYGVAPALPGQKTMHSSARYTGPTNDTGKGVKRWTVASDYNTGSPRIEVLLPSTYADSTDRRWPVLYVLPAFEGNSSGIQDGQAYIRANGFHDDYDCIVVQVGFNTAPWGGVHGSDATKNHRQYIRDVVMPFVEANYQCSTERQGRMLIGFSKSGVAAAALILSHPDEFGYAVSWDAPLMMQTSDWSFADYDIDIAFNAEIDWTSFLPRYLVPGNALASSSHNRIILLGDDSGTGTLFGDDPGTPARYGSGDEHTAAFAALLDANSISNYLDNTQDFVHASGWSTAWLTEALAQLVIAKNAGDAVDAPADSNAELGTP